MAGDYNSTFASPSGSKFNVNMSTIDADVLIDEDWELEIRFEDTLDSSSTPVWETMRDGFADELLAGGYVDVMVNGAPLRIQVHPTAETSQPGEYIINPDANPPLGAVVSDAYADPDDGRLVLYHQGAIDSALLPAVSELNDPAFDWATAVVTDVRTWIGEAEVSNDVALTMSVDYGDDEVTPAGVETELVGTIAGGGYAAMRDLLQTGTISFRVNGGAPNVSTLQRSAEEAESSYPAPVVMPAFIGGTVAKFAQYRSDRTWKPVISWGSSEPGTVVATGQLPQGLRFNWDTQRVEGTPVDQGTFPVTMTATNDGGQVTRDYSIVVGPNTVGTGFRLSEASAERDEEGTVSVSFVGNDYFRLDNPNVTPWLPIVAQVAAQGGYLSGELENLTMFDPNGDSVTASGVFSIEMMAGDGSYPDWLEIRSPDATFGDDSTATLNNLFAYGTTMSFSVGGGGLNTVQFGSATVFP